MPRTTFNIRVEVLNRADEQTAIATAAAYLAYSDQTDTIGYAPSFENVCVTCVDGNPIGVQFNISLEIVGEEHQDAFIKEMENLSRVVNIEGGIY